VNDLSNSVIFPLGERNESNYFTGKVWVKRLTPVESSCSISNVTFEPGCRNNWHIHKGDQILLVTGGRGYYQEQGKKTRELNSGDVVRISPGVKHWHGASADSWFVHISITLNPGPTEWLEPVTDQEYSNLN